MLKNSIGNGSIIYYEIFQCIYNRKHFHQISKKHIWIVYGNFQPFLPQYFLEQEIFWKTLNITLYLLI